MGKFKDLTGQQFERLLVLERTTGKTNTHAYWLCQCDCGNKIIVTGSNLRNNNTKACGCLRAENTIKQNKSRTIHNLSQHPLYRVWRGMRRRCHNPNSEKEFKNYCGRGITVCDEWRNSSKSFIEWALTNGWEKGLQIDRIDNDGNYCPENCRFVTPRENLKNKRPTTITHGTQYRYKKGCRCDKCVNYTFTPRPKPNQSADKAS